VRAEIERAGAPVSFQRGVEGSTFQVCQVLADSAALREQMLARADELGVQARAYFDPPVHRQPAFERWAPLAGALPVTDDIAARSLSLPMANRLSPEHIARIADATRVGERLRIAA
jgi:dTDP-4-amino-4,6-dideoxygalactose transaminase